MRYLIDGYNLFFKIEDQFLPLEKKREKFLHAFDKAVDNYRFQILIIFDGYYQNNENFASKKALSNIEVSFSPQHLSADQYLLELLEWNATNTTLITSDQELSKKASLLGAKILSTEQFLCFILNKKIINLLKKNHQS